MGKIFNKGLSDYDKEEELFKRLKNIENAQKKLIKNDDKDKKQQTNNIDTKPSNIFNYLKSLRQETEDLMYEIEEENDDIDIYKLDFIGSDREKFNFNTFRMPLNFLSAIYNGEISLKEAEFKQRDFFLKIKDLEFGYKSKTEKKKKKKVKYLFMQMNCWNVEMKLLRHLKMVFFCLNI